MITSTETSEILQKYDTSKLAIGTLGSHSSLNIFKGAKQEGFRTVCICKEKDARYNFNRPRARSVEMMGTSGQLAVLGFNLNKLLRGIAEKRQLALAG